jgi:hypothetical protein
MELIPSWEATSCPATQEILSILWNQKKGQLLVSILSQKNSVHTAILLLRPILILSKSTRRFFKFVFSLTTKFLLTPCFIIASFLAYSSTLKMESVLYVTPNLQ